MKRFLFPMFISLIMTAPQALAADIVHDAEYYIIEAQNGERWRADDKKIDARTAY